VYPSPPETPCLQGATTVISFLVVNHQATVGMQCAPGSVTLEGFLMTLMGPTPRYTRIIGLRLFVMSLISFALMLRIAYVLLEKWRHVHTNKLSKTIHLATGGSVANMSPSGWWERRKLCLMVACTHLVPGCLLLSRIPLNELTRSSVRSSVTLHARAGNSSWSVSLYIDRV
jgi:hypothetical protein